MTLLRLLRPTANLFTQSLAVAKFSTATARCIENHYQILGLEPGASAGNIKKSAYHRMIHCSGLMEYRQFYALSKTHHPDHNPHDPQASERFVKISEAYATLGNSQKRERYDRDIIQTQSAPSHQSSRGSYSGTSAPFGSRPASGLSRRRTQFKGPPPSFYRSGGWGSHGVRRQAQAEGASASAHRANTGSANPGGGFSPGQGRSGFINDVPHFDQEGHLKTQQSHEERWKSRMRDDVSIYHSNGADVFMRFLLVAGIVGLCSAPLWVYSERRSSSKARSNTSG